jgi:ADP-ribosyl-[dinitrogen reductase] hydrolase
MPGAPPKPPARPPPRRRGPPTLDPEVRHSRCRGALLGLSVGDAFGWFYKGKRLRAPEFPKMAEGPITEIRGDYERELKAGQVSDKVQMACCVAHVLRIVSSYNQREAVKQLMTWKDNSWGMSEWLKEVFTEMHDARLPEAVGKTMWLHRAKRPAFNDALPRAVPIAVFFADKQKERLQASLDDAALTHFDPRCQLAAVALNASIACAITSIKGATAKDMIAAANSEMVIAAADLGKIESGEYVVQVQEALQVLRDDLKAATWSDPLLYGPEFHLHTKGDFVRCTFRLAYWELCHAKSFEAGLLDVVNRGGDADTNAGVTGALLGAQHGEASIPERWQRAVLEVLSGPLGGPLGRDYHPRELLKFVDGLSS